ncbi:putative ATP-dependent Clp protease proteolytic subunit [Flavobacterium psychrophilum]|uniref:head maturation protease, ClpP-related n=1 Tax=Flavobacterium psychrophilum TaxID=96345 RepID=UPI000B7C3434|nr:head maturation protease, ClpP-related [Flavobacterium psychrophilum]SNA83351.1 putative ATP-dependent Clp protease proteolytic subunit [Flavobacterium psychrophilum]
MIIRQKENELYLYGTIWQGDGTYFVDVFSQMVNKYPVIDIHIHLNGGSVFDGNLIYNTIKSAKSFSDFYIDGIAASMGAIIILAGRNIYMADNAFIMVHAPSGSTNGTALDHEASAVLLRAIEKNMLKVLKAKTGLSDVELTKWLEKDTWISADKALEMKLITGIKDPVIDAKVEIEDNDFERIYNSYTALLINEKSDNKNLKPMKALLITALSLQGVTEASSDTAVIEAVKSHFEGKTSKLQADLNAKTEALTNLETGLNTQKEAQIKAILDGAVEQKKITANQRETYESIGKTTGIDALQTVLSGLGVRTPISTTITGKSSTGNVEGAKEGWDWDKYQKENPRALEKMAVDAPDSFSALYEAKFNKPFSK